MNTSYANSNKITTLTKMTVKANLLTRRFTIKNKV